ncbi:hypothetical protein N665_0008s0022 [Sinapis alba]|nr:hypothetical protein N665_0008s0022 [Sinapis alba]
MERLLFLIDAFSNKRITHDVFSNFIHLLFDNHRETKQDCEVRAKVDESSKKSSGAHVVGIRVEVDVSDEETKSEEHVTDKTSLDGKKRRIVHSEQARKSMRLDERVTPSYKLIPEEEQCPVSDNNDVLNNKYSVMQFSGATKRKKLKKYEEAMERCEDEMFETDMLIGSFESAVENAEKVIKEEMGVEDLGVKFYRCIEKLYGGDMSEIVREDHTKALPVILNRLKQKLDEFTVARESWKPRWKQVFEENTAKQREATRRN